MHSSRSQPNPISLPQSSVDSLVCKSKSFSFQKILASPLKLIGKVRKKTPTSQVELGYHDKQAVALKTLYSNDITLEIELLQFLSKKKKEDPITFENVVCIRDYTYFNGHHVLIFDAYTEIQLHKVSLLNIAIHLRELLKGLAAIHSFNIAHLDVNPSNIMLDHKNKWVLIDFGLARLCDGTPHPPGRGTQGYIAPELYPPDSCASTTPDIYSSGVIFGQMLEPYFPQCQLRILGGTCCFPSHVEKVWYELLEFIEVDAPCNDDLFPPTLQLAADLCLRLTAPLTPRKGYKRLTAQEALFHPFLTALDNPEMVNTAFACLDLKAWEKANVKDILHYRKRRRGMEVSRIIG